MVPNRDSTIRQEKRAYDKKSLQISAPQKVESPPEQKNQIKRTHQDDPAGPRRPT